MRVWRVIWRPVWEWSWRVDSEVNLVDSEVNLGPISDPISETSLIHQNCLHLAVGRALALRYD